MTSHTPLVPPNLLFASTPGDATREGERRLGRARELLNEIVAAKGPRTIANTLEPFNELWMHVMETGAQGELLFNVHPEAAVREAGNKAYQAAKSLEAEIGLHRPLYEAFAALDISHEDEETKYAVFKILRDFRRSGVDRDEATREKIKALRDKIAATGSEFDRNIRDDVRSVKVPAEELEGMPKDFIDEHPAVDGLLTVTTQYPDAFPIFTYAKRPEMRKKLLHEFHLRGHPVNLAVLNLLLKERYELARLLGYPSWAAYITEDKMIGSAEHAGSFIEDIARRAEARMKEDYATLVERKGKDIPGTRGLDPWDRTYYEERLRAEEYGFDSAAVREYFPYARVRDGVFEITGALFGVRYERVPDAPVWHGSVEAYDVYEGGSLLGRFYLDMHPREGKYGHAAAWTACVGLRGIQLPQSTLTCNFPDPGKGPALMTYDDVLTFFHEFGHLLHFIFAGHGRWVKNAADEVEWDFVEAPSQMLEEWVRDPDLVQKFARHHETGEPIPRELVERIAAADAVGRGLDVRRQMYLAALSLGLYNRDPEGIDTTAVAKTLSAKYSPIPWFEGTYFQCGFGHLNQYSAIYYTYMWSLVIAKDLLRKFTDAGPILNPQLAAKYRQAILGAASVKPARDMVKDFLGREPSFDAYEAWLNRRPGA